MLISSDRVVRYNGLHFFTRMRRFFDRVYQLYRLIEFFPPFSQTTFGWATKPYTGWQRTTKLRCASTWPTYTVTVGGRTTRVSLCRTPPAAIGWAFPTIGATRPTRCPSRTVTGSARLTATRTTARRIARPTTRAVGGTRGASTPTWTASTTSDSRGSTSTAISG